MNFLDIWNEHYNRTMNIESQEDRLIKEDEQRAEEADKAFEREECSCSKCGDPLVCEHADGEPHTFGLCGNCAGDRNVE